LDYNCNQPGDFPYNPCSLGYIRRAEHPLNSKHNCNINCSKQYKNIGRRVIILWEARTCLKIIVSLVLPSFSRFCDHPVQIHCHKHRQLSRHERAGVKICSVRIDGFSQQLHQDSSLWRIRCRRTRCMRFNAVDNTDCVGAVATLSRVNDLAIGRACYKERYSCFPGTLIPHRIIVRGVVIHLHTEPTIFHRLAIINLIQLMICLVGRSHACMSKLLMRCGGAIGELFESFDRRTTVWESGGLACKHFTDEVLSD
jgi:hypothetical protein